MKRFLGTSLVAVVGALGAGASSAQTPSPEIPVTGGAIHATSLPSGHSLEGWRWRAQLQKPPGGTLRGAWWQLLIDDETDDIRWRDAAVHYGSDRGAHDYRLGLLEVEERWRFSTHVDYNEALGENEPGFELTRHAFAFGITATKVRKVRITFSDGRTRTIRTKPVPRDFRVPYRVYVAYHVMAPRFAGSRHAVRKLVAVDRRGKTVSTFRWRRGDIKEIRPPRR